MKMSPFVIEQNSPSDSDEAQILNKEDLLKVLQKGYRISYDMRRGKGAIMVIDPDDNMMAVAKEFLDELIDGGILVKQGEQKVGDSVLVNYKLAESLEEAISADKVRALVKKGGTLKGELLGKKETFYVIPKGKSADDSIMVSAKVFKELKAKFDSVDHDDGDLKMVSYKLAESRSLVETIDVAMGNQHAD